MVPHLRLVLASSDPRRAALLRAAGFEVDLAAADVDTVMDVEETPDGYIRRVALAKVQAVMASGEAGSVLAAETLVSVDGEVLGVPVDAADAARVLRRLAGREHVVTTAVCLGCMQDGGRRTTLRVERTAVECAPLSESEIAEYVSTGEPLRHAGALSPNGIGSRFVTRMTGCAANVFGMPVAAVYAMCVEADLFGPLAEEGR